MTKYMTKFVQSRNRLVHPHAMVRATKAALLAYLGHLNDALLPLTVALDLVRRRLDREILTEGQQR
jgi:hypothetical protein